MSVAQTPVMHQQSKWTSQIGLLTVMGEARALRLAMRAARQSGSESVKNVTQFTEDRAPRLSDLMRMVIAAFTYRQTLLLGRNARHHKAILAHDLIGVHINAFGVYEGDSLDLVFDFLATRGHAFDRSLALDIGANIGNHALYFSERFERVVAYEPNPTVRALLDFNAAQAGNVEVRPFGLGDAMGCFHQQIEIGNLGGSRLTEESGKNTIEVNVRRLDEEELGRIDLIKIDVEGFESRVLAGALKTLEAQRPVVLFEQSKDDITEGSSPAIRLLSELGYTIHWIEGGRSLSDSWAKQGLTILGDIILRRGRRIVTGPAVPARLHAFLIALPG